MRRFFHDVQRYRRYMFYSAKAQLKNEVADFFAKLTPLYTYFTRFGA